MLNNSYAYLIQAKAMFEAKVEIAGFTLE